MKMMDITEQNTSIEKRALWWKTYSSHIHEEIKQMRRRTTTAIKKCMTQGMSMRLIRDVKSFMSAG